MAGSKGSKSGGSTSMGSKTGGSAATSSKSTGGSQKGSGGSSGSKVQGSSKDTMKAPGQDGFISRSGFESDPKGYFKVEMGSCESTERSSPNGDALLTAVETEEIKEKERDDRGSQGCWWRLARYFRSLRD
ncbi:hypothetical protein ACET3Z_030151 [Daucus carota]